MSWSWEYSPSWVPSSCGRACRNCSRITGRRSAQVFGGVLLAYRRLYDITCSGPLVAAACSEAGAACDTPLASVRPATAAATSAASRRRVVNMSKTSKGG